MNLPESFGSSMIRGCKVFALVALLLVFPACGGSEEKTDAAADGSVVSEEITISEDGKSGDKAAEAGKAEGAESSTTADAGAEASGDGAVASGEGAEDGSLAQKPEETKPKVRVKSVGKIRDPFVNLASSPMMSAAGQSMTKGSSTASATAFRKGAVGKMTGYARQRGEAIDGGSPVTSRVPAAKKPVVKVAKPNVTVTGILKSQNGYDAILQGETGQALIVKPGDVVGGGYKVTNIAAKSVTVVYKNKFKFVLPMEKEVFGSAAKGVPTSLAKNQLKQEPLIK